MSQKIHIRLATNRVNTNVTVNNRIPPIFTPGQIITPQNEFMRLVLVSVNFPTKNNTNVFAEDMELMKKTVI